MSKGDSTMNICFLSQEYPPETHVGGIGTYTYNMANALAKLGHTVHVITSTQKKGFTVQDNGVHVYRIQKRKIMPLELSRLVYSYQVNKKLLEINCRFDIVHASEYANEAFWFCMNKKYPLVTRLATPFFLVEKLNGKMFFGHRPFFNIMERKQTLKSDGIFSSTNALAKKVIEKWHLNPSLIEVIPNSIDLERVRRLGEKPPFQSNLRNKEFILYFGRLEERKGVSVLARALPKVFERFPSIYMVFVGSDSGYQRNPMRQYIETISGLFKERIIFYDNQPHEKLFPIVNSAKIVVLPSLWEAFGFVCVEALALGRPVIASSGSGFEEVIEDDISGFLIEPRNSLPLAQKIITCLSSEEKLRLISEGARRRAEDFDVTKIALRLLAYYEKIQKKYFKQNIK